jgi:hypothetical protein
MSVNGFLRFPNGHVDYTIDKNGNVQCSYDTKRKKNFNVPFVNDDNIPWTQEIKFDFVEDLVDTIIKSFYK